MKPESRFAACHPAVSFLFFVLAIVGSVFFQHPAYLLTSVLAAAGYLLSEKGRKAVPLILGMVPLFLVLSALNPLFNTLGDHRLFTIFGRPYTWEALYYGMVVSGMLAAALLWFSCYSAVMTGDKFTCLFGSLIPALSLILVMILRLIPAYRRKAAQISGARRCVGRSTSGGWKEGAAEGVTVLSALTSWALEGAIVTADAMRCRGYGAAKRTSFRIYRWRGEETLLLVLLALLFGVTMAGASLGWTRAAFIPALDIAPVRGWAWAGLGAYALLLTIPTLMNLWEAVKWHYFKSKI